jgi:uncharacterized protein YdeI (YjbR/CyaY-like superfamily)
MSKIANAKKFEFASRQDFRDWLVKYAHNHDGIWLIGHKKRKIPSISYAEALEEALCFGWIDGIVKSIDEDIYIRYFAPRVATSFFSAKNRGIIEKLEQEGKITKLGYEAIDRAKKNGRYQDDDSSLISKEIEDELFQTLEKHGLLDKFRAMGNSSKRAYLGFIASAKTETTKQKRIARSVERIKEGLALPG